MIDDRTLTVLPLGAQVWVGAEGTTDLPDVEDDEEPCVVGDHAILIWTRSDEVGDVEMTVTTDPAVADGLAAIVSGVLELETGRLEFGNELAGVVDVVDCGRPGPVPVMVAVDVPGRAARVVVVIGSRVAIP